MNRTADCADRAPPAQVGVLSADELLARIGWIVRLRWVAAAGVAAAIAAARWQFGILLPVAPLYGITVGLAAYNLALWAITRSLRAAPSPSPGAASALANGQISADLFFLAGLLYFSGGIENPFIFYFVFHVVIASILLSRRATYWQTTLAAALILLLVLAQTQQLAPHHHLTGVIPNDAHRAPAFAYGIAFAAVSTLFLTAYFATSITARLRQRERQILELSRSLEQKAAALSRANEKLRALERTKSEYMRRVAHELRSPLATVHQMLGLVLDGRKGETPAPAQETLGRARARVGLLIEVARDLLALSRAREADLSQRIQKVNLADVIAALAPDLEYAAREAQVALEISAPRELPLIAGDPESLAQLVSNLASNAIKYTPAGGRVAISASAEGGDVVFAVSDSGIGIAREELPRIFDEFYRAANARESEKEGTGLGLSIVKAICDSHGAQISVQSEPGRGSTFSVRFVGIAVEVPKQGDAGAEPTQ